MTDAAPSMFARIGGAEGVDRLVEAFYRLMDTQPAARRIRAMHPADLSLTKWVLKHYLAEWMGGPKLFAPESSRPSLRGRHQRFAIGSREKDAWLLCMRAALAETVADEQCRAEIDLGLTGLAHWMVNAADEPAGAASP